MNTSIYGTEKEHERCLQGKVGTKPHTMCKLGRLFLLTQGTKGYSASVKKSVKRMLWPLTARSCSRLFVSMARLCRWSEPLKRHDGVLLSANAYPWTTS